MLLLLMLLRQVLLLGPEGPSPARARKGPARPGRAPPGPEGPSPARDRKPHKVIISSTPYPREFFPGSVFQLWPGFPRQVLCTFVLSQGAKFETWSSDIRLSTEVKRWAEEMARFHVCFACGGNGEFKPDYTLRDLCRSRPTPRRRYSSLSTCPTRF